MMSKSKRRCLHRCSCTTCQRHPYSAVAQQHRTLNRVLATLDERSRRHFAGLLAIQGGRRSISLLSRLTGLSRNTIQRGKRDIEHLLPSSHGRIREPGGGRPRVENKQPGILQALDELLEDATAGDPITGLKWTRKTLRKLTSQLRRKFKVGHTTVARLLQLKGYALRVNRKRLCRQQDPQRDQQFRYIGRQRRKFKHASLPVISVDTKKKELIGAFKNPGRTWRRKPLEVLETDFLHDAVGKAIPYGIYDLTRNAGYVVVGLSHETAAFVVAAIRSWWLEVKCKAYPGCTALLIEADSGGANSNRCWLWKAGLQQLADEFGLTITVTHYPTGASKWNPVEHRLFGPISDNWAGQPLVNYETVLKFIRTTKTEKGLRCRARLDPREYETGLKVTADDKAQINLQRHRTLPKYNYTIQPRTLTRQK
jgi:hypothetical protein